MKNFLTILILGLSMTVFAAHHEETDSPESEHEYNFAYNSTYTCLLYTSPSPRDGLLSRMPSSA